MNNTFNYCSPILGFFKSDLIFGGCFKWNCFFCWIAVTIGINGVLPIKNSPLLLFKQNCCGTPPGIIVSLIFPLKISFYCLLHLDLAPAQLGTLKLISIWTPVKIQQDDEKTKKGYEKLMQEQRNTGKYLFKNILNTYITAIILKLHELTKCIFPWLVSS